MNNAGDEPIEVIDDLLIWQIADSAFPSGSFAHSGGLEASWQRGQVTAETLLEWVDVQLLQASFGILPFVSSAWGNIDAFTTVDRACNVFLNNHVANRASRSQGQSFLAAAVRILNRPQLDSLQRTGRGSPTHFAPVFGSVMSILQCQGRQTAQMFLFMALRGWLSSAVRLGIIGPLEAQRMQLGLLPRVRSCAATMWERPTTSAAQITPLLDILQASQDQLYSRLFQS